MAVLAANITDDTVGLIDKVLGTEKFVRFAKVNRLDLSDKTFLIRLALVNLIQHVPTSEEVAKYKAALRLPIEFDDFLETRVKGRAHDS